MPLMATDLRIWQQPASQIQKACTHNKLEASAMADYDQASRRGQNCTIILGINRSRTTTTTQTPNGKGRIRTTLTLEGSLLLGGELPTKSETCDSGLSLQAPLRSPRAQNQLFPQ